MTQATSLGLVAVGHKHPKPVAVHSGEFAQHERVEAVGLAARDPEPRPGRGYLVGVDRDHPQPSVKQPLDHRPIRALDRDELYIQPQQRVAQRGQARFVTRERRGQKPLSRFVDQHLVLLRRPVNASEVTSHLHSSSVRTSHRPDHEVPLRALIDWPSRRLRAIAACGTSHRREELVSCGPSTRQAPRDLSRRWPREAEDAL